MSRAVAAKAGRGGAPDGRPSVHSGDIDPADARAAVSVLGCSGSGLPEDLDRPGVRALLLAHRLEGLARAHGLPGGPAQGGAIEAAYRRRQIATGFVVDASERACRALAEAGIACVQFKGVALVRAGLYGDPGERPMDDADILVSPDRAHQAVDALVSAGFEPWGVWRADHTGWVDAFTLSDPMAPPAFPVAIDLHWRTDYGSLRFGDATAESMLWHRADPGRNLPAPGPHLLVIAEHLLKHLRVKPHLLACADLVRLCGRVDDWDELTALAHGRFFGPAVGVLLDVLRTDLGAPVPDRVVAALAAPRSRVWAVRERLRPMAMVGTDPPGRVSGLGWRYRLAPGPIDVLRDARAVVFPPRRWLRARYGEGGGSRLWLRYVSDCVRWAFGRGSSPASPNQ